MLRIKIILLCFAFSLLNFAQSPYSFDADDEVILFSAGVTLGIVDNLLLKHRKEISIEELNQFSRENINSFDRIATYNWSPLANTLSDIILTTMIASPLLLLSSSEVHDNLGSFANMYVQNVMFSYSLIYLAKSSVNRPRPYVYNELVPNEEKTDISSTYSFFSGHSTLAFSSAVFVSTLYQKYHPDSKSIPYVWGASLISASIVAYLRVHAGQHFPSDVITGALIGSLIGYLIPLIHEHKDKSSILTSKIPSANVFSFNFNF